MDKLTHFIVGVILGILSYFISLPMGLILSSIVFLGKEIYDCYKPNPTGFDWMDLLADYTGYFLMVLILTLLNI